MNFQLISTSVTMAMNLYKMIQCINIFFLVSKSHKHANVHLVNDRQSLLWCMRRLLFQTFLSIETNDYHRYYNFEFVFCFSLVFAVVFALTADCVRCDFEEESILILIFVDT